MMASEYKRKTFKIQAVQVAEEIIGEQAEWCEGVVKIETGGLGLGASYIEVPVGRVNGRTQHAYAYEGDWITRDGKGQYHVYRDKVFRATFETAS